MLTPGWRNLAGIFLVLVATGCGMFGGAKVAQYPCPQAGILKDAQRLTKFLPGPGRDLTDVVFQVQLANVRTQCIYGKSGVKIDMLVDIAAERGPADKSRKAEFAYFVAIANPAGTIPARERFTALLPVIPNVSRALAVEELEQMIPLPRGRSAENYRIIVGLQVTREELEFNRRPRQRR